MNRTVQTVQEDVDAIVPYSMHVSSRYLALTKQKLELTRLPRENETLGPAEQWALGTPKSVLEPLLDHWLETYDWRAEEDAFNSTLPQFRTRVSLSPGARGGDQKPARTHFVHKRSAHASAVPLLYCHSWPGSFVEVQRIIDQLASPEGEGELAFHVVCPSIPGFGFSDASEDPQFGVHGAAEVFAGLMRRLGYERWVVCGSGWGFEICRALAIREPKRCLAVHTCNPQFNAPTVKDQPLLWVKWHLARLTKAKYLPSDELWIPPLRAYRSTTDTLAFSLCDSPIGLLAVLLDLVSAQGPGPSVNTRPRLPFWDPGELKMPEREEGAAGHETASSDLLYMPCSIWGVCALTRAWFDAARIDDVWSVV
ncbi:uncharacterized protein EKO05_0009930 [Ascochyta rabiei]|uniref:uncharacterized protein n=1 Tax=Didymella rabiei TaxID=5454 RepID=UPI0021F932DC|nr:uncharacterized protein EKO05_0009930 [Ascochyta rabiei]UPX19675.1 hypothetical protein EKO05_0009930 [Ascochyta rabiei]